VELGSNKRSSFSNSTCSTQDKPPQSGLPENRRMPQKLNHLSMAYLFSNICTKYYWNSTTTVKIIVGGWVLYFLGDAVRVARYPVFDQTVRFFGDLSGQKYDAKPDN